MMSTTMISTAKQQIQRILQHLPDNCSIEDVQYHLYVVEKISRRLQAADPSAFVAQTEAERRLAKWLIQ
jgi:hypothetical protein